MKKLKIFLLLSILLCLGFALSTEVHAQGGGPKPFEVGDILPQGIVRISWDLDSLRIPSGYEYPSGDETYHIDDNNYNPIVEIFYSHNDYGYSMHIYGIQVAEYDEVGGHTWISPYTGLSGGHNYIDIDTSSFDLDKRTVKRNELYDYHTERLFWEEISLGYKPFEVGDVLPAGYIKISWDFNDYSITGDEFISIEGSNGFIITISVDFSEPTVIVGIMGDYFDYFDVGVGNTTIKLDSTSVITKIESDKEYNPSNLQNGISWEVTTVDEYSLGYEEAREKFGYYDYITNQWLSVEEYLELYGTDKMNQSDFYNNFDKYFIPAMIIVFGGAIVLTILKVFKGRE